jgi:hypothetical protein
MGKVRSNFLGTEFTISDGGRKPGKKEEAAADDAGELFARDHLQAGAVFD